MCCAMAGFVSATAGMSTHRVLAVSRLCSTADGAVDSFDWAVMLPALHAPGSSCAAIAPFLLQIRPTLASHAKLPQKYNNTKIT